jgi:hypothetical protein
MLEPDEAVVAQDHGAFDRVLRFTDVPGPVMGHEHGQRVGYDPLNGSLLQPVEPEDEPLDNGNALDGDL